MSLLAVSANDIDVSGLVLDVSLPLHWLAAELSDADVTALALGHLTTRLSRSGSDIVVRGRVKASVSTPCARCLAPTAVDVDAELSLLLRPVSKVDGRGRNHAAAANGTVKKGAKTKEPEHEFTAEDADIDTYDGETVVLDPFVREAILLEMPNFPLCSEACPGIGPAATGGERHYGSPTEASTWVGDRRSPSPSTDREPGNPASKEDEAELAPRRVDPRLAPLGALRDKLGQKPPRASDKRPQSASSRPAKAGTPKKKSKKE
jgi:uncharacterized protein